MCLRFLVYKCFRDSWRIKCSRRTQQQQCQRWGWSSKHMDRFYKRNVYTTWMGIFGDILVLKMHISKLGKNSLSSIEREKEREHMNKWEIINCLILDSQ